MAAISVRFDPYSPTAEEDYERLKAAVQEVDILGILGRELGKTEVDLSVTRQAITAIRGLNAFARDGAVRTLLASTNIEILSPVFVTLMRTIRGVYDELDGELQEFVDEAMISAYDDHTHILSVDLNLSYFLQVLTLRRSARKEEILLELFDRSVSPLLRRQIILAMANWRCFYFLTDVRAKYSGLGEWERRAFIIASYVLGDEGKHWREHIKDTWTPMAALVRKWFSERWQRNETIPS